MVGWVQAVKACLGEVITAGQERARARESAKLLSRSLACVGGVGSVWLGISSVSLDSVSKPHSPPKGACLRIHCRDHIQQPLDRSPRTLLPSRHR